MSLLFWLLATFILYTYLGYPLILYLAFLFRHYRIVCKAPQKEYPFVSVVIAARNEEKHIEKRIRNIDSQDYPKNKLELIVVSDGSTDSTNEIAEAIRDENFRRDFLKFESHLPSRGKPFCLNKAVAAAKGEIIVFADSRQRFASNAIRALVANFVDPQVGCVSGELFLEETPGSSIQIEMGAYWKFEKWLRKLESNTGSVPGATGAIYAIRKKLFCPLPVQTLLDDVFVPMHVCMQGFRTIYDEKAVAYDSFSLNLELEKKRKMRTLAGNWQLLILEPNLLNPLKNPVWIRFLSHKIFRLLVPYCLITLVILSCCLKTVYAIIFLSFIFLGCMTWILPPFKGVLSLFSKAATIFQTIMILNYFALLAPFKLMFGSKKLW